MIVVLVCIGLLAALSGLCCYHAMLEQARLTEQQRLMASIVELQAKIRLAQAILDRGNKDSNERPH